MCVLDELDVDGSPVFRQRAGQADVVAVEFISFAGIEANLDKAWLVTRMIRGERVLRDPRGAQRSLEIFAENGAHLVDTFDFLQRNLLTVSIEEYAGSGRWRLRRWLVAASMGQRKSRQQEKDGKDMAHDYFIVGMTNSALRAPSGQRAVIVFSRV